MITLIIGKKGAGKTLIGVGLIRDHLLSRDTRPVITNIDLRIPSWHQWARSNKVVLSGRFFCRYRPGSYGAEWVRRFWRDRGSTHWEFDTRYVDGVPIVDPKGECPGSCLYVVEEVQDAFSARQTLKCGEELLWYLSRCSQLGDRVFIISQHPELLDLNILRQADSVWEVENLQLRRSLGGLVRHGSGMRIREYPTVPSPGVQPDVVRFQKYDSSLYPLYRTASAGGGRTQRTQITLRKPRLTMFHVAVGGCAGLIGLGVLYWLGTRFLFDILTPSGAGSAPTMTATPPPVTVPALPVVTQYVHRVELVESREPTRDFVHSWVGGSGRFYVRFFDGRVEEVAGYEKGGELISHDGRRYAIGYKPGPGSAVRAQDETKRLDDVRKSLRVERKR